MIDDVGVGHCRAQVAAAVTVIDRNRSLKALSAHPAIAIPLRGTAFDAHTMQHSVAEEPVPGGLARIGAITQIPAIQFRRDRPMDRQVVLGQLVRHGRVIPALEELAGVGQVG